MKRKGPLFVGRNSIRDMHHLRLMALIQELVRKWGYMGTARVLDIDPRTVTSSMQSGQLTRRVRDSLQRALQHGIGSAADRQRERSDKLEARLDNMEGQLKELKADLRSGLKVLNKLEGQLGKTEGRLKELKETLPAGLKRLRMSLDGVRKYYRVQRSLIEQRLSVLEAGREGRETGADADDGSRTPEWRSITTGTMHPRQFKGPALAELLDAEESSSMALEQDEAYAAHGAWVTLLALLPSPRLPSRLNSRSEHFPAQRQERRLGPSQADGHRFLPLVGAIDWVCSNV